MLSSGITKIFISIDATTEETYNAQRLSGQFDKVVKNVEALVTERNEMGKQFPLVRVSFLKNKLNIHEADDFDNYWKSRVDIVAFQQMSEVPDVESGLTLLDTKEITEGCTFPFKQLVVDCDGNILPCCKMTGEKLTVGNVNNMTLQEAWNSDDMKHLRYIHKSGNWASNDICRKCISNADS